MRQIIITNGLTYFIVEVNGGQEIHFENFDEVVDYLRNRFNDEANDPKNYEFADEK